MLKVVKKENIKPQKCSTRYVLQYQNDQIIEKLIRSNSPINLQTISKVYQQQTSINSQILAQIIQKLMLASDEHNHNQNTALFLKLSKLSHDQRELRHYLKNKFKIDANLLLLLLWNHRQNTTAIYLVNVVLDVYTVQLMLNGRQILTLWKQFIHNKLLCQKSRQDLNIQLALLSFGKDKKQHNKEQQFRNVVIPL